MGRSATKCVDPYTHLEVRSPPPPALPWGRVQAGSPPPPPPCARYPTNWVPKNDGPNGSVRWTRGVTQGCIRRGRGGGGGLAGTPLLTGSPCGPHRKAGPKSFSLNPLGAEGAKAKLWLSASNIGRGGGGGGGVLLRCTAVLIHPWGHPNPHAA